jgi:hypothetical protein
MKLNDIVALPKIAEMLNVDSIGIVVHITDKFVMIKTFNGHQISDKIENAILLASIEKEEKMDYNFTLDGCAICGTYLYDEYAELQLSNDTTYICLDCDIDDEAKSEYLYDRI